MENSDIQRIRRINKYCVDIAQSINRFGKMQDIFFNDLDYQNSIAMSIMQIGELSIGLSDNFKDLTREQIPWGSIRGMRNLFAHDYGKMDKTEIWDVATNDIPKLHQFCKTVLCEGS